MEHLLNQKGNVNDIRGSLSFSGYTKVDILLALFDERKNKNRITVINLLKAKLRKL